jgi:hypothetical protein
MSQTPPRGKRRRTQESDTEGSGLVAEAGRDAGDTKANKNSPRKQPASEDVNGNPEPMDDAGELCCSTAV